MLIYSKLLCMKVKIYITVGGLAVVTVCYTTFEVLTRRDDRLERRKQNDYLPIRE